MRKPFGRLVEEVQALSDAEMEMSMGAIAERLGVTVERLADAMDAVKMLNGEPAYIPLTERACESFRWVGQTFASCDNCGKPYWEPDCEDT
jgi:hypothetical protein